MLTLITLIAALVGGGQPIAPDAPPTIIQPPAFTVHGDGFALIVPHNETVHFDAPTTAIVTAWTTGTLPVAIRYTNINLLDSVTSLHWIEDGRVRFDQQAFVWGPHQFEFWHPSDDDPATQTMWINVAPPEVRNSPVREVRVTEMPDGSLYVRALSDRPNLQLWVNYSGEWRVQPISPTDPKDIEEREPFEWWGVAGPAGGPWGQFVELRVTWQDTRFEHRHTRSEPVPPPVGTATPTPTPTPGPGDPDIETRLINIEYRQAQIEARLDALEDKQP